MALYPAGMGTLRSRHGSANDQEQSVSEGQFMHRSTSFAACLQTCSCESFGYTSLLDSLGSVLRFIWHYSQRHMGVKICSDASTVIGVQFRIATCIRSCRLTPSSGTSLRRTEPYSLVLTLGSSGNEPGTGMRCACLTLITVTHLNATV